MSHCFSEVKLNVLCHEYQRFVLTIATPPAKREWVNYFILNINLNINVQHTMNTCVTNNAMHLLEGLDTCSSLIYPVLSIFLQTIEVNIWKEQ